MEHRNSERCNISNIETGVLELLSIEHHNYQLWSIGTLNIVYLEVEYMVLEWFNDGVLEHLTLEYWNDVV